jgi:hypothetical protein
MPRIIHNHQIGARTVFRSIRRRSASEAMVSWLCHKMGSLRLACHFSRLIVSFRENKVEPKYFFTESSLINGKSMMDMLWLFSTNNASHNNY